MMSISSIAAAWGVSRDKVKQVLATVPSEGVRNGYPTWTIRASATAMVMNEMGITQDSVAEDGSIDPSKLPPKDRKDWYESELKREQLRVKQGELLLAEEVAADKAETYKALATTIQTLDDVLERDLQLSPEQTQKVSQLKRRVLESLQMAILGDAQ